MRGMAVRFQRGSVAVMTGLTIAILIGFIGISVDLGRLFVIKAELQTAMDACALAASSQLRPGLNDDAALDRAIAYGRTPANKANFQDAAIDSARIEFSFSVLLAGPYTAYSYKAGGVGGPGGLARTANYVRCTYPMADVPVMFMRVLPANVTRATVAATAVGTLAPSQTNCGFPVAVCRESSGSATSTPPWGLTPGQWVGGLGSAGGGGGGSGPAGCTAGTGTGNFCWIDFSPPNGGASELSGVIQGGGQCDLTINSPVGQTGVAASLKGAWNTRFGIYAPGGGSGGNVTTARPDLTGYSYTAANWSTESNAYSDFTAKRTANVPFNSDSGIDISPSTAISSADHHTYGRDRRLVLAPIVNCSTFNTSQTVTIDAWACVLLLAPITVPGGGSFSAKLEYLGLANQPGTPCATSGLGGGTSGPLVPVLVQ